jgi:hypothetical protein
MNRRWRIQPRPGLPTVECMEVVEHRRRVRAERVAYWLLGFLMCLVGQHARA